MITRPQEPKEFNCAKYRQKVDAFRPQLDHLVKGGTKAGMRNYIDEQGKHSLSAPYNLMTYARTRLRSVARVLALFEIVRREQTFSKGGWFGIKVESGEAVWQAFKGTNAEPACHTCPCHVNLNGQHPTQITQNRGLQRHIIVELANCVIMPKLINDIDNRVDNSLKGAKIFVKAVSEVLNAKDVTACMALNDYVSKMKKFLASARHYTLDDNFKVKYPDEVKIRLDMIGALFEAVAFELVDPAPLNAFKKEVLAEARIP